MYHRSKHTGVGGRSSCLKPGAARPGGCSGTCGWLFRLLMPVRLSSGSWCCLLSGLWSRVRNAFGLQNICLPKQGSAVRQATSKVFTPFGLPSMSLSGNQLYPAKDWGKLCPEHPFLCLKPGSMRLCLTVAVSLPL
jgi:hypothetical protein